MNKQYSILFIVNSIGFPYIKERLKALISKNDKVGIIPWTFPVELTDKEFNEE